MGKKILTTDNLNEILNLFRNGYNPNYNTNTTWLTTDEKQYFIIDISSPTGITNNHNIHIGQEKFNGNFEEGCIGKSQNGFDVTQEIPNDQHRKLKSLSDLANSSGTPWNDTYKNTNPGDKGANNDVSDVEEGMNVLGPRGFMPGEKEEPDGTTTIETGVSLKKFFEDHYENGVLTIPANYIQSDFASNEWKDI